MRKLKMKEMKIQNKKIISILVLKIIEHKNTNTTQTRTKGESKKKNKYMNLLNSLRCTYSTIAIEYHQP